MTPRRRTPASVASSATPEQILAEFPREVQALAGEVRRFVLQIIPTAAEVPYPGWRGIGFRDPQSGYFCGLFPQRDHVKLGFEHGAELPDPDGLFEGGGKQVRYVIVRTVSDLRRPALARLLQAAVLHGSI